MRSVSTKLKFAALLIFGTLLVACTTDLYEEEENPGPDKVDPIVKPDDFVFSTIKELTLTVNVDDEYQGLYDYQVKVYDVNPFLVKDAIPLYGGVANVNKPWVYEGISFAQTADVLYVMQIDPTQGRSVKEISLDGTETNLVCDFRPVVVTTKGMLRSSDDDYSTPLDAQELKQDDVAKNGKIDFDEDGNWVIRQNSIVELSNIQINKDAEVSIYVEGTLIIGNNSPKSQKGELEIVMQAGGVLKVPGGKLFDNGSDDSFELIVNKQANVDLSSVEIQNIEIKNYGTCKIKSFKTTNSDCDIDNYCNLEITNLDLKDSEVDLHEGSILKCNTVTSQSVEYELEQFAIFRVEEFIFKGEDNEIEGDGSSWGIIDFGKIVSQSNKPLSISENIQVLNTVTGDVNKMNLNEGAKWVDEAGSVNIPASECTGDGNVVEKPEPSNPSYPIIVPGGAAYYTFAMEDNWPDFGDYDMNDLVLGIQNVSQSINNDSKVTGLSFDVQLLATGATKTIGAGIQFIKLAPSQVEVNLSPQEVGNSGYFDAIGQIEAGNSKAVLPLLEDAHFLLDASGHVVTNTYNSSPVSPIKTLSFALSFPTPVSQSDVTIQNMDFFIVIGGNAKKRQEVHVAGYMPTDRMKGDTNGYISSDEMAYGIMLPIRFAYPTENKKITDAYPHFAAWSQSSGKENADWYNNPIEGSIYDLNLLFGE